MRLQSSARNIESKRRVAAALRLYWAFSIYIVSWDVRMKPKAPKA
jgi:hypothetical protein